MGKIGLIAGLILVAGLAVYLVWTFHKSGKEAGDDDNAAAQIPIMISLLCVTFGLTALLFSAQFLVYGAISVARSFGVSEAFIDLTIVATGTSLPELATSLIAAFRRQSEIANGNIEGSNIFNILGILGATELITPIPVASRFLTFDLPIMIAVSFVLTGLLLMRRQIGRGVGAVMLLSYIAYVFAA
ncbi:MAG: cation:H+ antiporter [Paracoccaceae bacterium]